MSFKKHKTVIEEGDAVVIYLTINNIHTIDVFEKITNKKGDVIEYIFQTSFGALKVKSLIGVEYGSKVELTKGWCYVFQPNAELWTQTLPHRTQILYTPDISMILLQLEIKPGSVVIESGTGSGSLSHYFLRALKPHGHLHTFDFHEARVEQARDEFKAHGLNEYVTCYHRDVCANGFDETLNGLIDAVFLDLPAPHTAVPAASKALKESGGRFCSFSPCIEQSQKCCETLEEHGFVEIQSLEVLQNEEIIKMKNIPVMDLEFLKHKKDELNDNDQKQPKEMKKVLTSSLPQTLQGHTGFLTFATLPPSFAR